MEAACATLTHNIDHSERMSKPSVYMKLFSCNSGDPSTEDPVEEQRSKYDSLETGQRSTHLGLEQLHGLSIEIHRLNASSAKERAGKEDQPHQVTRTRLLIDAYCDRAASLLEYVNYDASAFLPQSYISRSIPQTNDRDQQSENNDDECPADTTILAVQQALEDLQAAITIGPSASKAHYLAGQCSRSLGSNEAALEYAKRAHDLDPENTDIQQFKKELQFNADEATNSRLEAAQIPFDLLSLSDDQPEQAEVEPIDDISYRENLQSHYRSMEAIARSPLLAKMESTMHHNIHHQCASQQQVQTISKALSATASFLSTLLRDDAILRALCLDQTAISKDLLSTNNGYRGLVENRTVRKWIVNTVAPATRRVIAGSTLDCSTTSPSGQKVIRMIVRDVLVVLARLLLAVGSLKRCTVMPHALVYIKMVHDLVRELGDSATPEPWFLRLEMMSIDSYAVGLLDLTNEDAEALMLHQQSLQIAIHAHDRAYELRCHHHLGRALVRMQHLDLAESEFVQVLQQSRLLGDSAMECIAQYELGLCCIAQSDPAKAQKHFIQARRICNRTAHCSQTLRDQSIEHALEFYARVQTTRRRVIHIPTTLVKAVAENAPAEYRDEEDQDDDMPMLPLPEERTPVARRGAIYSRSVDTIEHKSIMQTLIGDYQASQKPPATESSTFQADEGAQEPKTKPRRPMGWRDSVITPSGSVL